MLDIANLKVDIEGSRVLNGISLTVGAGELVCLIGRNGAGKTTTFRSIMGYRRALSGGIRSHRPASALRLRNPRSMPT
jgi:branched-chain amino acid transport system ATP-binding protein